MAKLNYILNHFDKIKEYFPAIADLFTSYRKGGRDYKYQHRLNIEDGSYEEDQELKTERRVQWALYKRDTFILQTKDKIGKLEYYVNRIKSIINDEIIRVTAQGYKDYFTELYIATVEERIGDPEDKKMIDKIVLESGVPYEEKEKADGPYEKIEYTKDDLVKEIREKYKKKEKRKEQGERQEEYLRMCQQQKDGQKHQDSKKTQQHILRPIRRRRRRKFYK